MAVQSLSLYVDVENRRLVKSYTIADAYTWPKIVQANRYKINIYFVREKSPTDFINPMEYLDYWGAGLKMGIFASVTGTAGSPDPLAAVTSGWTQITNGFQGTWDLNTAALAAHIGTASSATCVFEITMISADDGTPTTMVQESITVYAIGFEPTSVSPSPSSSYYTKDEADLLFIKKDMTATANWGIPLHTVSSDGVWQAFFGIDCGGNITQTVIS